MSAVKETIRRPLETALKVFLASLPPPPIRLDQIQRILVFAYHGLGNFVMFTPALKLLRERYPAARIDLQVGNNTGCDEVLAGAGIFDNIYNLPYSAGLSRWARRAFEIRQARYDLTINEFHSHSWPIALLTAFSGAPFRLGHVTSPGWSHRFSRYSFVFNIPIEMRENEHEIDRYLDLIAAVSGPLDYRQASTFIHLTGADGEFAERFLGGDAVSRSAVTIGMQPGTSPTMRWKQWPLARYREIIQKLLAHHPDARIVLFGSASERPMICDLARDLGSNVIIAAGKTTVKQAAALIQRCQMLVCNDSGLMHLAVAVGTPVVAIYGPTDIRRTAPIGSEHTVIRHDLACSPCFKLEGDGRVHLCQHHDCLMTITSEEVLEAINEKLIDRTPWAGATRTKLNGLEGTSRMKQSAN